MGKLLRFVSVLVLPLVFACAHAQSPVSGFIYTGVSAPVSATSNQAGSREGRSCASSILGIIATGDASIEAARRAGGISQISAVDEETTSVLGVYASYCTIVRGR